MPYRFSKADIISGSIVQSRELDNAVGNYVDVMNGGMDRDNLPYGGVGSASCDGGLFQSIKIFDNINPTDTDLQPDANYVTLTPNRLGRLMYGYRYGEDKRLTQVRVPITTGAASTLAFEMSGIENFIFIGYSIEYQADGTMTIRGKRSD